MFNDPLRSGLSEFPNYHFFANFVKFRVNSEFPNFSRGRVSDPAGILHPALAFPHLVPRIQQQPYLNGFLSLLYHFMNSAMPSCRLQWGL